VTPCGTPRPEEDVVTTTERAPGLRVRRFAQNPILSPTPRVDALVGSNINGPSLIRVPDWLPRPLGRYYLYFAHHRGTYIRLAFADRLEGPWQIYEPGTLRLAKSHFLDHIASPDVHVDEERREIRMYYHGIIQVEGHVQRTRVARSFDGLHFVAAPELLGAPYFRVFRWNGWYYALGMPGICYRSRDGLTGFEQGPTLFTRDMRHTALKLDGDTLSVFYTNAGDCPERILLSTIALTPDWHDWRTTAPVTVLEPETEYEGADEPLVPSRRGLVMGKVRQLRDPAIFQEDGRTYLLYAVAGEHGIAIAELEA
jgi:hypothetical protein